MKRLKKDMARVMDEATARGETPCALALLWRNGEEKLFAASGHADLGLGMPAARDTIFRLYSLTKPMTAVAAMTLIERGQLDVMAPVSDFLPAYKNQRVAVSDTKTVPAKRPMQVRDLFSMTSGLCYGGTETPAERATETLLAEVDAQAAAGAQPDTVTVANRLGELPLAFHPGESWRYGTSADVLGAVVEVVSGQPLDQYMRETIFVPLGMADTGFFVPPEKQSRLATLYERKDGILSPYLSNNFGLAQYLSRPNFISGGAGLVGTADDVLRFGRMLLGQGELGGERVLSPGGVSWLAHNHLTPKQQEAAYFDSLLGQGYGGLMRVLLEPGKSFSLGVPGEFGWDGWAGAYMTVCPAEELVFVVMQQLTDSGTSPLTRKLRNLLYASLS